MKIIFMTSAKIIARRQWDRVPRLLDRVYFHKTMYIVNSIIWDDKGDENPPEVYIEIKETAP